MIPIISQLSLDKNGIYKQMILKSIDIINYNLKVAIDEKGKQTFRGEESVSRKQL